MRSWCSRFSTWTGSRALVCGEISRDGMVSTRSDFVFRSIFTLAHLRGRILLRKKIKGQIIVADLAFLMSKRLVFVPTGP